MIITDGMILNVPVKACFVVNVSTGALSMTLETDGSIDSILPVEGPSTLTVPSGSKITFSLNGDTASITEL